MLLLLSGFGIVSAHRTDGAARHVSASSALSDVYQRARFAVGEEESLERKYRLEPGREVRGRHERAARELEAALTDVSRIGTPDDRVLVARLLAIHSSYLEALDRMFAAVDAHDAKLVLAIDGGQVDPRFGVIVSEVDTAARAHAQVAAGSLRDLRGTERSVLAATPLAFALGLLLLGFLTWLLSRINRQLARQALESEHDALHDEFELHYQPEFTTTDLRLAGVEALVRWRHPTRGLMPPGDFIALAEHTGLIRPLTLLVLRKALRQGRLWRDQGLAIAVAVNLSLANLVDAELVDDVARILDEERVAASALQLEITESTIMTDPERVIATLDRLAAMGISLSLDDYGTGHSSLARLRRLPVHELKIDRSFIQHLSDEGDDLAIVRSTIDLGHNLGLRVVAEGVEDAASLALLAGLRCDLAQGFHLGRPVPPDVLLEQLRHHMAAA